MKLKKKLLRGSLTSCMEFCGNPMSLHRRLTCLRNQLSLFADASGYLRDDLYNLKSIGDLEFNETFDKMDETQGDKAGCVGKKYSIKSITSIV